MATDWPLAMRSFCWVPLRKVFFVLFNNSIALPWLMSNKDVIRIVLLSPEYESDVKQCCHIKYTVAVLVKYKGITYTVQSSRLKPLSYQFSCKPRLPSKIWVFWQTYMHVYGQFSGTHLGGPHTSLGGPTHATIHNPLNSGTVKMDRKESFVQTLPTCLSQD